jgi:hypothetical protein
MARKTFYMDKHGIRVDGCANKTEARKAWVAKRDAFARVAAECRPWVFAYAGHVLVVAPLPEGWEYTIVRPSDPAGVRHASCYFNAALQCEAIAQGLAALAQNVWTRECPDDGAMWDDMVACARMRGDEIANQRYEFLHVVEFWRAHPIAA